MGDDLELKPLSRKNTKKHEDTEDILNLNGFHYDRLEDLVESLFMTCRFPGCGAKVSEFLIKFHEDHCNYKRQETLIELPTPSESLEETIRTNLWRSYLLPTLEGASSLSINTVTHIITPSDTEAGLVLNYGVDLDVIKSFNHLFGSNLHERSVLFIPTSQQSTFSSLPSVPSSLVPIPLLPSEWKATGRVGGIVVGIKTDEVEEMLKKRLVKRFKREQKCHDSNEAMFYLVDHDFDIRAAVKDYASDCFWEKAHLKPIPNTDSSSELEKSEESPSQNKNKSKKKKKWIPLASAWNNLLQGGNGLLTKLPGFSSTSSSSPPPTTNSSPDNNSPTMSNNSFVQTKPSSEKNSTEQLGLQC